MESKWNKFDRDDSSIITDLGSMSLLSEDRFSDDTDLLITQNVSLKEFSNSLLDDRSSTTTDLLYQQVNLEKDYKVNQTEGVSTESKPLVRHSSPNRYNDGFGFTKSTVLDSIRANEKLIDVKSTENEDRRRSFERQSDFNRQLVNKPSSKYGYSHAREEYQKSETNGTEQFKMQSKVPTKSSKSISDRHSFTSKEEIHSNDSKVSGYSGSASGLSNSSRRGERNEFEQENKHFNLVIKDREDLKDNFRDSHPVEVSTFDEKVKEGQALVMRLLGDIMLQREAQARVDKALAYEELKDEEQSSGDHSWKQPPQVTRSLVEDQGRRLSEEKGVGYSQQNMDGSDSSSRDVVINRKTSGSWKISERISENVQRRSSASTVSDTRDQRKGSFGSSVIARDMGYTAAVTSPSLSALRQNGIDAPMKTSTPERPSWSSSPRKTIHDAEKTGYLLSSSKSKLASLQAEIEQELQRKQDVMAERTAAEESLVKIKMNMQSLEQLADQHRRQAVSARSELMEIEQQRNEAQRVLNEITDEINERKKQIEELPNKQKEFYMRSQLTTLARERDELIKENSFLKEKCKEGETFSKGNAELMKQMRNLQEQLYKEQDTNKEKIKTLTEELQEEKKRSRDLSIEKLNTIKNIKEEVNNNKKTEIDAFMKRMEKEKAAEIEIVSQRHYKILDKKNLEIKDKEQKIQELKNAIASSESRDRDLRDQLQLAEMNLNRKDRENKEMLDEQQVTISSLQQEFTSIKERNESLIQQIEDLEQSLEDKNNQVINLEEKLKSERIEREKILKNKQSEIETLQSMVRQQEDATRNLGEKLRAEAKEQIRMAVEAERTSRLEELKRAELELEKVKSEQELIVNNHKNDLSGRDKDLERLMVSIGKLKKELEESRHYTYEIQEEKLHAVNKTRNEMKEEIEKIKERMREFERVEKMITLEITEECTKTAVVTGKSYPSVKKSWISSPDNRRPNSTALEALANLRSCNADLRKQLLSKKKQIERCKDDYIEQDIDTSVDSLSSAEILRRKDESLPNLERTLQGTGNQNQVENHKQDVNCGKLVDRMENEIKRMELNANDKENQSMGKRKHRTSSAQEPSKLNSSLGDSSTAKLLRHLQGRVKQLRAENQSLKRTVTNDGTGSDGDSTLSSSTFEMSGEQSPSTHLAKVQLLEESVRRTEEQADRNATLLRQKISEMTKLQRMLTQATKENMKLERAHADLQQKFLNGSAR